MVNFKNAAKVIEQNRDLAEFGGPEDAVSRDWVEKAELALGIRLPPSYRWWLESYGGGEICGEEIYSIYGQDFDSAVGGDIVYNYRIDQRDGICQPNQIVICHSDIDGSFFFDCSKMTESGEYPVMSSATGTLYASDFLEFLLKRISVCRESDR